MASSNRHWPSMFKSKQRTTHDHRNPYAPAGAEERAPDPKPRWNPRPEQIRILEGLFNSGTVNPQRDEIHRIRVQLQEFGPIGDANVFYWFQNRKSRIKQKQRQLLQNYKTRPQTSSSSSSSNNSNCEKTLPINGISSHNSPATHTMIFEAAPVDFPTEPSFSLGPPHGVCFPDHVLHRNCSSKMKTMKEHFIASPSLLSGESSLPKTTVFINDICFEIPTGAFNVRGTFGEDAVLFNSSGEPVPTDESGLTHQPLQHGAFYHLLRAFTPSPDHKIV